MTNNLFILDLKVRENKFFPLSKKFFDRLGGKK